MVAQFREDFADYARDGDGENIAFIDGMIYQGEGTQWYHIFLFIQEQRRQEAA